MFSPIDSQAKWRSYYGRRQDDSCRNGYQDARAAGFESSVEDYIELCHYCAALLRTLGVQERTAQLRQAAPTALGPLEWPPRMHLNGIAALPETPLYSSLRHRTAFISDELERRRRAALRKLPDIPHGAAQLIRDALEKPSDTLVLEKDGYTVTVADLRTLQGTTWLNDEVINVYYSLLCERANKGSKRVHMLNTFFYPTLLRRGYDGVKRWTRTVDVFSFDLVVAPIHLGMHWCMACVDTRRREIAYYDSLRGGNQQCLDTLLAYLRSEHQARRNAPLEGWTTVLQRDLPLQQNGYDCGVFCCIYADFLIRGCELVFSQEDMPYFRQRMSFEILHSRLL